MDNPELHDLDLDIAGLVGPGRKSVDLMPEVVRPLQAADLTLLALNREVKPLELKKLSQRHHGLAKLLAGGMSPGEAGMVMRYEGSRVSILQGDPAFKELIEFYKTKVDEAFDETMEHLSGLSLDAVMELRERLESEPENFSNKELRELAKDTLDRSGYGPSSKQEVSVTHNLGERLERARLRALEVRKVIDITPDVAAE